MKITQTKVITGIAIAVGTVFYTKYVSPHVKSALGKVA